MTGDPIKIGCIPVPVIWGVPPVVKPFCLPAWFSDRSKVRLRFRPCELASACVRDAGGIRHFLLRDENYYFTIDEHFELGRNQSAA